MLPVPAAAPRAVSSVGQSASLTPRMPGVRVPHRPPHRRPPPGHGPAAHAPECRECSGDEWIVVVRHEADSAPVRGASCCVTVPVGQPRHLPIERVVLGRSRGAPPTPRRIWLGAAVAGHCDLATYRCPACKASCFWPSTRQVGRWPPVRPSACPGTRPIGAWPHSVVDAAIGRTGTVSGRRECRYTPRAWRRRRIVTAGVDLLCGWEPARYAERQWTCSPEHRREARWNCSSSW